MSSGRDGDGEREGEVRRSGGEEGTDRGGNDEASTFARLSRMHSDVRRSEEAREAGEADDDFELDIDVELEDSGMDDDHAEGPRPPSHLEPPPAGVPA
jgi:hypothetical protein